MRNKLFALKTWQSEGPEDGKYDVIRYPRGSDGVLVPASSILDHISLQCVHLAPPRIFTDPDNSEQVYAICAASGLTRCDYFVCVSDIYHRVSLLGDLPYSPLNFYNDEVSGLRTWHYDGEYLARYPRHANGDHVTPLDVLAHETLQCRHLDSPRIFSDPDIPEQVYAVCDSYGLDRCDYLICVSDILVRDRLIERVFGPSLHGPGLHVE